MLRTQYTGYSENLYLLNRTLYILDTQCHPILVFDDTPNDSLGLPKLTIRNILYHLIRILYTARLNQFVLTAKETLHILAIEATLKFLFRIPKFTAPDNLELLLDVIDWQTFNLIQSSIRFGEH